MINRLRAKKLCFFPTVTRHESFPFFTIFFIAARPISTDSFFVPIPSQPLNGTSKLNTGRDSERPVIKPISEPCVRPTVDWLSNTTATMVRCHHFVPTTQETSLSAKHGSVYRSRARPIACLLIKRVINIGNPADSLETIPLATRYGLRFTIRTEFLENGVNRNAR